MLNFILFADDTNIFLSGEKITDLCKILTNELKGLDIWFKVNKLSLNISDQYYGFWKYKKPRLSYSYK